MPYGKSWTRFCMASVTSLFFMFAGAQTVHMIYKPLEDLDSRVQQEIQNLKLRKSQAASTAGESTSTTGESTPTTGESTPTTGESTPT